MKKIILAMLLAALVLVTMVACGGETTTAATTTEGNPTNTTVADTSEGTPDTTTEGEETPENPPLYEEGENILNGEGDFMAINPFTFNGMYPCAFENFHEALDFEWAVVINMTESVESVYEQLIGSDPTLEPGGDNQYKWVVEVNGTEYVVSKWSVQTGTTSGWVRMSLGANFEPAEGNNTYDIRLKIHDVDTNELIFWAWLTDPGICGGEFKFNRPSADGKVKDDSFNTSGFDLFDSDLITLVSGPEGSAAEGPANLFDKDIRTKLCTGNADPVIFTVSDNVVQFNLKAIGIIGANDDDAYDSRIIKSFKLYGANTNDENTTWDLVCTGERASVDAINYQERGYNCQKDSGYKFYKIEFVHEGVYQIGEIQLWAEKDSVIVNK